MEDLTNSAKAYLRDKLASPYLFSCIATFIGINRKLVYGIFNFQDELSVDDRVEWIHDRLWEVKVLYVLPSGGFYGQILYSIVGGFVIMFVADKLLLYGKKAFIKIRESTVESLQKLEPEKWVESSKYDKIDKRYEETRIKYEELNGRSDSLYAANNRYKEDNNNLNSEIEKIKKNNIEIQAKLDLSVKSINDNSVEIQWLTSAFNNINIKYGQLIIILAIYGSENDYSNVTEEVRSRQSNSGNERVVFEVNNDLLGDPSPGIKKNLILWFQIEGIVKRKKYVEGTKVVLPG